MDNLDAQSLEIEALVKEDASKEAKIKVMAMLKSGLFEHDLELLDIERANQHGVAIIIRDSEQEILGCILGSKQNDGDGSKDRYNYYIGYDSKKLKETTKERIAVIDKLKEAFNKAMKKNMSDK